MHIELVNIKAQVNIKVKNKIRFQTEIAILD